MAVRWYGCETARGGLGACFGHSMTLRGALASVSRIIGCDSPKVSPPHFVNFLNKSPARPGPDLQRVKERRK